MPELTDEQAARIEELDRIIAQCEAVIASGTWDWWDQEDLSRAQAERFEILRGPRSGPCIHFHSAG